MLDQSSFISIPEAEPRRDLTLGTLHGIGLGPGDPDLVTIKAVKLIQSLPVLAFFAKKGGLGHAHAIATAWMPAAVEQLPLYYPLTTEIRFTDKDYVSQMKLFYDQAADGIALKLATGKDVGLLCEGDPMFYGSFMHIFMRLRERFTVCVTAGVSGMSGCSAAAAQPMTWGDDVLTVLPATLSYEDLSQKLAQTDAAVIMKLGSNFAKVRAALQSAKLIERALYIEHGTTNAQRILPLSDKTDDKAPYFSLILVPGQGRRP